MSEQGQSGSKLTYEEYCRLRVRKHREISARKDDEFLEDLTALQRWSKRAIRRWTRPASVEVLLGFGLIGLGFWLSAIWLEWIGGGLALTGAFQYTKLEYYWKGYMAGYDAGCEDIERPHRQAEQSGGWDNEDHGKLSRVMRRIPYELRPMIIMLPLMYATIQWVTESWLRWLIIAFIAIFTAIVNFSTGIDETSDIE